MAALLFVFEGADGVGKTRRCHDTYEFIARLGVPCDVFSFSGKMFVSLRQIVHTILNKSQALRHHAARPYALQTLHIAAQIDAIERDVLPALRRGRVVLLDRFWWSTWVYGSEAGVDSSVLTGLVELEQRVWRDVMPTAVFFIDREKPIRPEQSPRIFKRLRCLYQELAGSERKNYPVFTIRNDDFDIAQAKIQRIVKDALSTTEKPSAPPLVS